MCSFLRQNTPPCQPPPSNPQQKKDELGLSDLRHGQLCNENIVGDTGRLCTSTMGVRFVTASMQTACEDTSYRIEQQTQLQHERVSGVLVQQCQTQKQRHLQHRLPISHMQSVQSEVSENEDPLWNRVHSNGCGQRIVKSCNKDNRYKRWILLDVEYTEISSVHNSVNSRNVILCGVHLI